MTKQPNKSRFFRRAMMIGMVALGCLGTLGGCGEGMADSPDSVAYALTGQVLGPYGSVTGTPQASSSNHLTPVTKIVAYGSTDNVYGIKLFWGTTSFMYGQTNGAPAQTFNVAGDPVYKIEYSVSSGNLRGIKFTNSSANLIVGNMSGGVLALSNEDAVFTDLQTWKGNVNEVMVIWGAKIYYTTP